MASNNEEAINGYHADDDDRKQMSDPNMNEEDEEDDFRANQIFPQRLMAILSDERNSDCIAWLPHGRAFIIRNRKLFAEKVISKFFTRKAKYSSFTRKLNRWNFVRISSGPELGAYYHEFFLRDKPHLAAQMFCKNARTKLAMATHGDNPASLATAVSAATISEPRQPEGSSLAASMPSAAVASRPEIPIQRPNLNISSHYAAAAAALKQNMLPPGASAGMMLQLREQQQLLELQMRTVQQADPSSRLLLQQAILKEQASQMQQMGLGGSRLSGSMLPPTPSTNQNLLATTLALQQSQARLMQAREVLKLRLRLQNNQQSRSPQNNRASAA